MYGASEVDELFEKWRSQGMTKEELIVRTAEAELGWPYVWGAVGAKCTPEKRQYYANRGSCPEAESKVIISRCQALNGSGKYCGGCEYYPDNMRTLIDDCQGFVKQVCSRVGISFTRDTLPQDKLCCIFWQASDKKTMSHIGFYYQGWMYHCSGTVKKEKLSAKVTHWAIPRGLGGDTPMPTHRTIRRGDSGEDVKYCQELLLKLGYDLGSYGADGRFGAKTQAAVKSFQGSKGLTQDGIVGPRTWQALEEAAPEPGTKLYTVTVRHVSKAVADEIAGKYGGTVTEE